MKAKGKLFAVKSNDIKTETYYSWRVGTLVLCHTQHGGVIQIPSSIHSLIRGVLIQSCPAGAKDFTNYVFCHPQFSGVIQNIENCCAIRAKI